MKIGTNGIVTNEAGQVLLIQRDDSRTFAPPGGTIDIGELLTDNVAREVREETGLIVMPVRLVGIYFSAAKPEGMLVFVFRCIQRGGEIATSEESLQVDYFWPKPLPQPMLTLHEERLERGLSHAGGPPFWGIHRQTLRFRLMSFWLRWWVYPRMNRARERAGGPAFVPPPQWQVTAVTLIRNKKGQILWLTNDDKWRLPGGIGKNLEAPWETAVRLAQNQINQPIQLSNLSGVYVHPKEPALTMTFIANPPAETRGNVTWVFPGEEPNNCLKAHVRYAADAIANDEPVIFDYGETAVHD
jgi:ADP-ribose pyrophosphatase YjhB (NUDIX family)